MRDLEKAYGLVTKEQLHKDLIKELREKLRNNTITKPETVRLIHLVERYQVNMDEGEGEMLKQTRVRFGLLSQIEKDM